MGDPNRGGAEADIVRPYEGSGGRVAVNRIDAIVFTAMRKRGIVPAHLCSDEVFVRRVFVDVIGTLPTAEEAKRFLADGNPRKHITLVNSLFERPEFTDYRTLKWCDLLRMKSEFPINLWPNAVQAYHGWVHNAIRTNMPYDQFARELLTASGSNFRTPQVNFYRAIQGRGAGAIAGAAALTFMGPRIEKWPKERRAGMEAFFSRVAYKKTDEWKEEIVYPEPKADKALDAVFPDGRKVTIEPGQDGRAVFADWLITANNPWFARNAVNRVWAQMMGRGIIHEPDDMREDNAAVYPELLAYLEKELVASKYDLRHIFHLILNSRVYQQSCIPQSSDPEAEAMFAYYPVRRLDAEVLIDALCSISGIGESYSSAIPEPFTFIPANQRTIALADGSISSPFLEMFGRPARDTGLESERNNQPSDAQRLHLLYSSHIQQKIERSGRLREAVGANRDKAELIRWTYLGILSRYPTPEELGAAQKYFETGGLGTKQAEDDLAWSLINTKEFLYRH